MTASSLLPSAVLLPLFLSVGVLPAASQIGPLAGGGGLTVTTAPTIDPTRLPNTGPFSVPFTVTNTGTSTIVDITMSCLLSGPVTCGTVTPGYVTSIGPGAFVTVTVTYSVGAVGSGSIGLQATPDIGNPASKSRTVTVANPGKARPSFVNYNPDNLDRGLCLTAGAGEAAGVSCGDLFMVHSMPGYATLGRERSLTLYYNSAAATGLYLLAANIIEPTTIGTPDKIKVILTVGTSKDSAEYAPALTYPYDRPRQVVLGRGLAAQPTGVYAVTLFVRNVYPGASVQDTTITGTAIVVNRSSSEYGSGWSLAGVERLVLGQPSGAVLWLGGDASAKLYSSAGTNVWTAPAGAFRDTLRYDPPTLTYTRTLRHGIKVTFDAQGRHIRTTNRAGQVTTFFWNQTTGVLDSLAVPPAGQPGTVYRLVYSGGKLDRITDPAGRMLDATVVAGKLTQLVDPDTTIYHTDFAYDASGRLTGRTNRRGFTTTYAYANGARVTRVTVPLDTATATRDTAKTDVASWDEKGLALGYLGQAAADTQTVYTRIDGPRTDVADSARFWVDRWGATTKIVDPLGATTQILRGDAAVPALVTQVTYPDNRIVKMTWNARGNLTKLVDSTVHLGTAGLPTATTRWAYASLNTKDSPDTVVDPVGLITRFAYDSLGLPSTARSPNGHVTRFEIVPSGALKGVLQAVSDSFVIVWDTVTHSATTQHPRTTFAYNALGNDTSVTTPLGLVTKRVRDATQRVDSVLDPGGHGVRVVYDALNRVREERRHVTDPGLPSPLVTTYTWGTDALQAVTDHRGVPRSYGVDAALRPKTETDDYGRSETRYFSRASLVDSVKPRAYADTLPVMARHRYDAAGRLLATRWVARDGNPADSVVYTYDIMGQMLTATTVSRKITRTYFATGAIKTEKHTTAGGGQPYSTTYGYDAAGRRVRLVIGVVGDAARSDSVTYAYDAATGDLRWIKARWRSSSGVLRDSVRLHWDALGRRDSVVHSNGARVRFAYDADGRLRLFCGRHTSSVQNDVFKFTQYLRTIDADGLIRRTEHGSTGAGYDLTAAGCEAAVPPSPSRYAYDSRHQVTLQVVGSDSSVFAYDASGNRTLWRALLRVVGTVERKVDYFTDASHNRLRMMQDSSLELPDSTRIVYDADGSRTIEQPYNGQAFYAGGYRRYRYDGLGRPTGTDEYQCVEWFVSGGCKSWSLNPLATSCSYDPLGRLWKPCENLAPQLGFDGENVIRTGVDSASLAWTFVHGPGTDDPMMAHWNAAGSGYTAYIVTDGAGRQVAVGDAAGYDCSSGTPCGQTWANSGGKYSGGTGNARSFKADRHASSSVAAISFFRNRWYDQQTGRWTQEDPIGVAGGINLYSYVGNNPATFTDPFGLKVDTTDAMSGSLWRQLQALARNAAKSKDNTIAAAGVALGGLLNAIDKSDKTWTISFRSAGLWDRLRGRTTGTYEFSSGNARTLIDPVRTTLSERTSNELIMLHEGGHAFSAMSGNPPGGAASYAGALAAENLGRAIFGCQPRLNHFGPPPCP